METQKTKAAPKAASSDGAVLARAVQKIGDFWGLTNETLGEILGLSGATVSRLRNGSWYFPSKSKSFELAQYLVRLFRSLDSMMGSDDAAARSWLAADNLEVGGKPAELIRSIKGLSSVADYVDHYRAKV